MKNKKIIYKQVYEILNLIDYSNIPDEIMEMLENKMEKNYEFNIQKDEIYEETKELLSVIYTEYLASDEEKEVVTKLENLYNLNNKKIEYKEDIFKKDVSDVKKEEIQIIKKESFFTKILNFIKRIIN